MIGIKSYNEWDNNERDGAMTLLQLKYAIMVSDTGSMNEAAKQLYITQPSLSASVRELEQELGFELFKRSSRGVSVTPKGKEFLGYARQVAEQYRLLEDRFINQTNTRKHFAVSMQHYTFAVKAFVELVQKFGMDEYEFAVTETRTADVIDDVKNFKSEIGIIYMNDFNSKVLCKILRENGLEFVELFGCRTYVYMCREHPLAGRNKISMDELTAYPCLSFDQGNNNSFYYAEEVLSTYDYKRMIKANDRATMLNLMVGLNGYTLCSGIICEELNGTDYCAVRLDSDETMHIGYIMRKGMPLSEIAVQYVDELKKYKDKML